MKLLTTAAATALLCTFVITSAMACSAHKTHSAQLPNFVASLDSPMMVKKSVTENMSVPTQQADGTETIDTEARIVPTAAKAEITEQ